MEKNFSYIKNRIKQVAENKGIPVGKFFKELGVAPSGFTGEKVKKGVNSETIQNLISIYPDINLHWLITGEGKIYAQSADFIKEPATAYNKTDDVITNEIKNIVTQETDKLSKLVEALNSKLNAMQVISKIDEELLQRTILNIKDKTRS